MHKDSTAKTLLVAFLLCLTCSVLVSTAAVKLKSRQVENKKLDIKKNLLLASKLIKPTASKDEINEAYKNVEAKLVDLETGEFVTDMDPGSFDAVKASKDPKRNVIIPSDKDIAKIKRRSKIEKIYFVKENGVIKQIVLPVNGKGLWSTLYGFMVLGTDTKTVLGLGFYQHGETAGLGGEVDNPKWKAQWAGKVAFDNDWNPVLKVVKGGVVEGTSTSQHEVDGLSGATITGNGVTGLVNYWLGSHGFGSFLAKFRASQTQGGM
ncbi:MAG: Na(+)-translocating NADH-quinone reductase subunit C [Halobacteriovorax sp.]|nr:Na(+)-translocating NADH-quinone reductase subunit C [Halobacteriovorax sp.]|tara:strand:+ start:23407 stop:24198 length:792 start_codon:yes stop_codon:yes gene_type:complete